MATSKQKEAARLREPDTGLTPPVGAGAPGTAGPA